MIRFYAYYNFGGYKDMYLGGSNDHDDCTYFLPLLSTQKQTSEGGEKKSMDNLKQIEILTLSESHGFPKVCFPFFSHGAYLSLYYTTVNGEACLAIRDIPDANNESSPFSMIILTDGEDISKLDRVADDVRNHLQMWLKFFSSLFTFDIDLNGLKFHLKELIGKIDKINSISSEDNICLNHMRDRYSYVATSSTKMGGIFLKELHVDPSRVVKWYDISGNEIEKPKPALPTAKRSTNKKKAISKIVCAAALILFVGGAIALFKSCNQKAKSSQDKETEALNQRTGQPNSQVAIQSQNR